MTILFAIVGAVVGAILGNAGGGSLGLGLGAVVGILLTRQTAFTHANVRLVERIERLEAAARLAEKTKVSSPAPPPVAEPAENTVPAQAVAPALLPPSGPREPRQMQFVIGTTRVIWTLDPAFDLGPSRTAEQGETS